MQRRDFIQAAATVALLGVPASADAYRMPVEPGPFRPVDLVDLKQMDPTLKLDIRYATTQNFMHKQLYPAAQAFMQRPAAEALVRVQRGLQPQGLGLVVFDAYRPWSVTRQMAEASPPAWVGVFVANPNTGSRHNRGCAVDVTLAHLDSGEELAMPTGFDDFTPKAPTDDMSGSDEQKKNRASLQKAMQAEGFTILLAEWWHFDYQDWKHYAVMDVPFSKIGH